MIHRYVERDRSQQLSKEAALRVLIRPLQTEKGVGVSKEGQYLFEVSSWANKFQIARAIESILEVQVAAVNTVIQRGKVKRFKGRLGQGSDVKKAYVTLKEGFTLDFESVNTGGEQ